MTSPDGAADPPWPPIVEYFAHSKSLPTGRAVGRLPQKALPQLRRRRRRSINVDVRLRFLRLLRLLRRRWIYDCGIAFGFFRGRIRCRRDSLGFLFTSREQRGAS